MDDHEDQLGYVPEPGPRVLIVGLTCLVGERTARTKGQVTSEVKKKCDHHRSRSDESRRLI